MIKVLIVDDSETVRELLAYLISKEKDMLVVAQATNGEQAVSMSLRYKPDIITMDVSMPVKDGIAAIREIMSVRPCPIIIVSEFWNAFKKEHTTEAYSVGALGVVNKPRGPGHPDFERDRERLIKSLRLLSEVKVVTRKSEAKKLEKKAGAIKYATQASGAQPPVSSSVVIIGASTGGPVAIKAILDNIPQPFHLPILIVQHISLGCLDGLVQWLASTTKHDVVIAQNNESALPGKVYFAPDEFQMGLTKSGHIRLYDYPKENGLKPSVSYLFRSALAYDQRKIIAVLLTGMGADGAPELLDLKSAGATTIIQEQKSCVVFGMPGEAYKLDAQKYVLEPSEIGNFLSQHKPPSRESKPSPT